MANELDLAETKHMFFFRSVSQSPYAPRLFADWFIWNGNTDMQKIQILFPHLKSTRFCVNNHEDAMPLGLDFDKFWDRVVALESWSMCPQSIAALATFPFARVGGEKKFCTPSG